ncbi:MAG: hypothetical protein LBB82_06545 [Treponema sp.]|jgi:hypothetical protein|nr:hypothetical protein [Treponema sp.]
MELFDRAAMRYFPLAERKNRLDVEKDFIDPAAVDSISVPAELAEKAASVAAEILAARERNAAVIFAFGAHTIKNGLGLLLGEFIRRGWVTHLAANGAAVIHDWEFACQGRSGEDVRANAAEGKFGAWEETGLYINLALALGAWQGLGYGESIGAFITNNGLDIPDRVILKRAVESVSFPLWKRAAAADLLEVLESLKIEEGPIPVEHKFARYSVQAAAYEALIPFTSHPMFGHDIIYTHRANRGAVIGRTAERDFLSYVRSVSRLEGGVYLSVGSAVMSPMIFEKALSMARNTAGENSLRNCHLYVVDLQEALWDWKSGEPPMDNPAYYLRFMKTFNRMGCPLEYFSADNRLFFAALYRALLAAKK